MNYTALIVAGGQGLRMGLGYNKVFYQLSEGKTVLDTTLQIFRDDPRCAQIVIVTNQADLIKIVKSYEAGRIVNVGGGPTRQDSVLNGLMAVTQDVVLIHDAVRPWTPKANIDALLAAMETEQAAILSVKVKDTIKEVRDGYVTRTIDRSTLVHAQTPQAFNTKLLLKCHHQAENDRYKATDDAQIVEKYGQVRIKAVEGSYANIKITTLEDIK